MASAQTSLNPIDADIVRGRKPLTAPPQFIELDDAARPGLISAVERCLAEINLKLLGRIPTSRVSSFHVSIKLQDQEVVEEALSIMRTQGGWGMARVFTWDDKGWCVLEFDC